MHPRVLIRGAPLPLVTRTIYVRYFLGKRTINLFRILEIESQPRSMYSQVGWGSQTQWSRNQSRFASVGSGCVFIVIELPQKDMTLE
jgi:hypothetical protein